MRRRQIVLFVFIACLSIASGFAQDPLTAFPKNYALALDNADVSVIRAHYRPHERIGVHDHSKFPTIYVYVSDSGPVRFNHDEQPSFSLTRPSVLKGAFRVSPGRIERHSVENLSDISSDFLRVELKRVALETLEPFRGRAPKTLSQNTGMIEYTSPNVTVQRVICVGPAACRLDEDVGPFTAHRFFPGSPERWRSSRVSAKRRREVVATFRFRLGQRIGCAGSSASNRLWSRYCPLSPL